MQDRRFSNGVPLFDLLTNPFHCLGVHPNARDQDIHAGYEAARLAASMPAAMLQFVRDTILDPASRLFIELTYLSDSSIDEITATYGMLSRNMTAADVVGFAKQLPPISRANLIAHLGARQAPDSTILCALVEAHALLDVGSTYTAIKTIRAEADRAASSLFSIDQCLTQLYRLHARAVVASYPRLEDAAAPLSACAETICVGNDPYQREALERLLSAYRDAVGARLTEFAARIVICGDALSTKPADASQLNELATAFNSWALLCRPLMVWDASRHDDRQDAGKIVERFHALIENLATDGYGDVATYLADLAHHAFSTTIQSTSPFADELVRIEQLSLDLKLIHLRDFVDQARGSSPDLAVDLNHSAFGSQSIGKAKQLWEIFLKVTMATTSEAPWVMIGDLAVDLGEDPRFHTAALALLAGLIHHGEQASVGSIILDRLRETLQNLESQIASGQTSEGDRKTAGADRKVLKTSLRLGLIVVAFFAAGLGTVGYYYYSMRSRQTVSPASAAANGGRAETIPPVGSGQHLELSAVRYCHYQEERLKLMTPDVQGPEAVRAFNLLAVDYNSRCSDFFYKNEDLATVQAELIAHHARLVAEAKQLISKLTDHSEVERSALP